MGMIVVMVFFRWREDRRIEMAAMTRAATHAHSRVLHHAHVVLVDILDHLVHEARGVLLRQARARSVYKGASSSKLNTMESMINAF